MNEDTNKGQNQPEGQEEGRTMGQQVPGQTIEQRKRHKDTEDSPQTSEGTLEEKFYNDQNVDPNLAKKQ